MNQLMKKFLKPIPGVKIIYKLIKSIYPYRDYLLFRQELKNFSADFSKKIIVDDLKERNLILVCGNGMEIIWIQLWLIIVFICKENNYKIHAITSKKKYLQNLYLKLSNINLHFIEDINEINLKDKNKLNEEIKKLNNFISYKNFYYQSIPLGKMAISTYCRQNTTGILKLNDREQFEKTNDLIIYIMKAKFWMDSIIDDLQEPIALFTEVFMEEFGGLYYSSLLKDISIIQFSGTEKDNAFNIRHLNSESDRTHITSMSSANKKKYLNLEINKKIEEGIDNNFKNRYSNKWFRASISWPNTINIGRNEARRRLDINPNQKVAIIYSHILYDTLFFNGEDIYSSYAEWFVESVKLACKNKDILWFIKIHPSNLWRGELNDPNQLNGEYEEIRLIKENIHELPKNIRIIYPDTIYSPLTWLKLTDYGITVRGTSGIELAALGKIVITAGTGRYETIGITKNPTNIYEYEQYMSGLQNLIQLETNVLEKAKKFAYFTFCMKPFKLGFLKLIPKKGVSNSKHFVDMKFKLNFDNLSENDIEQISKLVNWLPKKEEVNLLNDWPV